MTNWFISVINWFSYQLIIQWVHCNFKRYNSQGQTFFKDTRCFGKPYYTPTCMSDWLAPKSRSSEREEQKFGFLTGQQKSHSQPPRSPWILVTSAKCRWRPTQAYNAPLLCLYLPHGFFWGWWEGFVIFFEMNPNNYFRTTSHLWKPGLFLLYMTFPKVTVGRLHLWQHADGRPWPLLQTPCTSVYFNPTLFPLGSLSHCLSVHVTCCTKKAWGESSRSPVLKLGSISHCSQLCQA